MDERSVRYTKKRGWACALSVLGFLVLGGACGAGTETKSTTSDPLGNPPLVCEGAGLVCEGQTSFSVPAQIPETRGQLRPADLDADGDLDFIVSADFEVITLINQGDGELRRLSSQAVSYLGAMEVELGDLNGDGRPDVIVAAEYFTAENGLTVEVLLNKGDGSFAPAVAYPVTNSNGQVIAADLDEDGDLDLAVQGKNANVDILVNQGKGTFAPAVFYDLGGGHKEMDAADLNGDGKTDLVFSMGGVGARVLLNKGDGTFAAAVEQALPSAPASLTIADLNGDARPDFVYVPSPEAPSLSLHVALNQGDGSFASPVKYSLPNEPDDVVVTDIDGDERPDIAVTYAGSVIFTLLFNQGDGTFARVDPDVGVAVSRVFVADLNGDAKPDIVAGGVSVPGDPASVLMNQGERVFSAPAHYARLGDMAYDAWDPHAIDVDGDGHVDLATMHRDGLSVALNQGDGTFGPTSTYFLSPDTSRGFWADVNSDGKPDCVANTYPGITVMPNDGAGHFGPAPLDALSTDDAYALVAADFNGDARADLAALRRHGAELSVMLAKADGSFAAPTHYDAGSFAAPPLVHGGRSFIAADVNGDKKPDLAMIYSIELENQSHVSGVLDVRFNQGGGVFSEPIRVGKSTWPMVSLAAADFNGDGKDDLALAFQDGEVWSEVPKAARVSVLISKGDGAFSERAMSSDPFFRFADLAAGDLDGDGRAELVIAGNPVGGDLRVIYSLSNGEFGGSRFIDVPGLTKDFSIVLADLSGDGRLDLGVSGKADDDSGAVDVLLSDRQGNLVDVVQRIAQISDIAAADLNGDGALDLFGAGSPVNVLFNQGHGGFGEAVRYPAEAGPVVAADFNGDCRVDLATGGAGVRVRLNHCDAP